jgi:hypothetical protein
LGLGDEDIEVNEVALGGVGVNASEEVGETFEGDRFDTCTVEESDGTAGIGENEEIALAAELGDSEEGSSEIGGEEGKKVAGEEAGVECGEDEFGRGEGQDEVGGEKAGREVRGLRR